MQISAVVFVWVGGVDRTHNIHLGGQFGMFALGSR